MGKYILCEGGKNSYDRKILDIIVTKMEGIDIIPMGGKLGSGAFLQGFLGSLDKHPSYLTFRDRDFDADVPETVCLTQSPYQKKVYMSYRTTIENYLLLPENIFNFCQKKEIGSFNNIAEVTAIFRKAAEDIKFYQAARWALGAIRVKIESGTSWTTESGELPQDLGEEACKNEAQKLLVAIQEQVKKWDYEHFERKYTDYLNSFDTAFFEENKYLVHFQAKDLQAKLSDYLPAHNGNSFSFSTVYNDSIHNFDYTKFPDLVELEGLLRHL